MNKQISSDGTLVKYELSRGDLVTIRGCDGVEYVVEGVDDSSGLDLGSFISGWVGSWVLFKFILP